MSERRERGGHGLLPFLVIPATVMAVKAMHRHRAMRANGWGPGAFGPGPGHHAWGDEGKAEFRLPPRIESFLTAWHEQAHQAAATGAEPDAAASSEAPTA